MTNTAQKKSKSRSSTHSALQPGILDSLKRLTEENFMTAQTPKGSIPGPDTSDGADMFARFAGNDAFWWPFRAVSKALLQTQRNSIAYLDANRRLLDEMRKITRKEQDLLFELSESTLAMTCRLGKRTRDTAPSDRREVNDVFDRAMTGIRELGEAWIDAQVRSLDAMRSYNETRRRNADGEAGSPAQARTEARQYEAAA